MSAAGGKRALLIAALVVAAMRLWMQLRGKTKTPFVEWAIGWGALFFMLSLLSEVSPQGAGLLSVTVVTGDVLANGTGLFKDVSGALSSSHKGGTVFTDKPFADVHAPQQASGFVDSSRTPLDIRRKG